MKNLLFFLFTSINLLLSIYCNAQTNDPCGCNKALQDSLLRDEITSIYNVNLDSALSLIYSKSFTYWENGEWKNDQSMQSGGDAYYSMYSGFLNASDTKEQKRSQYQNDSTYFKVNKRLSFSQYKYFSQKTASLTAYTAWSACKHDCIQLLENGEVIITKSIKNLNQIRVDVILKKGKHSNMPIKVTQINAPNATIISGDLRQGKLMQWGETYSSTFKVKNSHIESAIKINLSDNWESEEIPIPSIDNMLGTVRKKTTDNSLKIDNGELNMHSKMGSTWENIGSDPINQCVSSPIFRCS